jgi:hypothetical protein
MTEDRALIPERDVKIEEHGAVTDVIVPLAQAGVAGAVGAAVSNHLGKSDQPPPRPDPPTIELPPGVDRD